MSLQYNNRCLPSTTILVRTDYNKVCSLAGMKALKDRLAWAMKEAELTQAGLAEEASKHGKKVSQQVVQHLLSGRNQTSGLLPEIALGLGVPMEWLTTGKGKPKSGRPQALLVGKVGAGNQITRFSEGTVLASIEPPPGVGDCNAAQVVGDSMYPRLEDGWLLFYGAEHQGVPESCIGKMCVVQLKDGTTLVKTLKMGAKKGLFRLESFNAPTIEDVRLEWAAKVIDIRPT